MIKKQRIGTSEYIILHGEAADPKAVFYVREFQGGEIKNVIEAKSAPDGWEATLEDGRLKTFSLKWLQTVFLD